MSGIKTIELREADVAELPHRGGDRAWYYVFSSGNGGLTLDEFVVLGFRDRQLTIDYFDEWFEAVHGSPAYSFRGFHYVLLDGHSTLAQGVKDAREQLEKAKAALKAERAKVRMLLERIPELGVGDG